MMADMAKEEETAHGGGSAKDFTEVVHSSVREDLLDMYMDVCAFESVRIACESG